MATWPTSIDDDGTGTTGTILNDAYFDAIQAYIDAPAEVITVANGGGNVFDVVLPTPKPLYYIRVIPSTAPITIASVTPGRLGDSILIDNVGGTAHPVWLQYGETLTSHLANRVKSGPTPLAFQGSALYVFDGIWRLAQHDQGKAISVPYSAANFTSDVGTWTVEAGDVIRHDYQIIGNELVLTIALQSTTTAGSPNVLTVKGWPYTFAVGSYLFGTSNLAVTAGTGWSAMMVTLSVPQSILFQRFDFAAFANSSNAAHFTAQVRALLT